MFYRKKLHRVKIPRRSEHLKKVDTGVGMHVGNVLPRCCTCTTMHTYNSHDVPGSDNGGGGETPWAKAKLPARSVNSW